MVRISYWISLQIKNVFHHPPKIKDELWFLKIQIIFQMEFLSLLVFKTNEKKSSSLSINFIFEISVWWYLKRLRMSTVVWDSIFLDGQSEMDAIWSESEFGPGWWNWAGNIISVSWFGMVERCVYGWLFLKMTSSIECNNLINLNHIFEIQWSIWSFWDYRLSPLCLRSTSVNRWLITSITKNWPAPINGFGKGFWAMSNWTS